MIHESRKSTAKYFISNSNVTPYTNVKEIPVQGNNDEWSLQDEAAYELLDKDITEAMLHA
jgi:hypothetical protein